jgi:N-acetylmuramoyl-L-alanine amidase
MKKVGMLLCSLLMLIMWVVPNAGQAASSSMSLVVNGNVVKTDVAPQVINQRTMVPISFVGNAYGVKVSWESLTKTVVIDNNADKVVRMRIGQKTAYLNGKAFTLEQAPIALNGRTFLPLRQVGELLGATIAWDADSKTVIVNKKESITVNGETLFQASIYQFPYGNFVKINDVVKPLGYEVKQWSGKLILEQGTEKYTISQASTGQTNGYHLIDGQFALTPEFLAQTINGTARLNTATMAYTLDKLQYLTDISLNGDTISSGDTISIQTDGKTGINHFRLDNPSRIVVDFNNTKLKSDINQNLTSSLIKNIHTGQYSSSPNKARVVIELAAPASYEVVSAEGETKVVLKETQAAPTPAPTPVPPTPAPSPQPSNNGKYVVVVDAGHGGNDTGAIGTYGNYEKNLTLAIASKVVNELKKNPNFNVVITRTAALDAQLTNGKKKQELGEKTAIANNLKADVFLSVHINSGPSTAHGTESFYTNAQSKEFADIIHKHLVKGTGTFDRGLKARSLYVTRNTKMPSTLVEIGFITNKTENDKMLDAAFQQRVAEELAAGVTEYYNKHH